MNHDTLIKRFMMLKAMYIWRTQLNMLVQIHSLPLFVMTKAIGNFIGLFDVQ